MSEIEVIQYVTNGSTWWPEMTYNEFCDYNIFPTRSEDVKQSFNECKKRFENMSRFKCENDSCDQFTKEVFFCKVVWISDPKTGELKPKEPIVCPDCGGELIEVKRENKGFPSFMKFSSMSEGEKRQMLAKRARKDDAKHKQENDYKSNQLIKKMKKDVGID